MPATIDAATYTITTSMVVTTDGVRIRSLSDLDGSMKDYVPTPDVPLPTQHTAAAQAHLDLYPLTSMHLVLSSARLPYWRMDQGMTAFVHMIGVLS